MCVCVCADTRQGNPSTATVGSGQEEEQGAAVRPRSRRCGRRHAADAAAAQPADGRRTARTHAATDAGTTAADGQRASQLSHAAAAAAAAAATTTATAARTDAAAGTGQSKEVRMFVLRVITETRGVEWGGGLLLENLLKNSCQ